VLTERAAEGGNDGVVIMADGTKYVSSVRFGSVSRYPGPAPTNHSRRGGPTTLINPAE